VLERGSPPVSVPSPRGHHRDRHLTRVSTLIAIMAFRGLRVLTCGFTLVQGKNLRTKLAGYRGPLRRNRCARMIRAI
jgi:hypothetical protein